MAEDYNLFIKSITDGRANIEDLIEQKQDLYMQKLEAKGQELINANILEEIKDLQRLAKLLDDSNANFTPTFVDEDGITHRLVFTNRIFGTYVGYLYVKYDNSIYIVDIYESIKSNKLVWRNNFRDLKESEIINYNTKINKTNIEAVRLRIKIIDVIITQFPNFKERVLECFYTHNKKIEDRKDELNAQIAALRG